MHTIQHFIVSHGRHEDLYTFSSALAESNVPGILSFFKYPQIISMAVPGIHQLEPLSNPLIKAPFFH